MPNSKQAKKRQQQSDARRDHNKEMRSAMRSAMKRVLRAETGEEAARRLPEAFKKVDKAAKKRVIHPNAAARYKSRLSKSSLAKAK